MESLTQSTHLRADETQSREQPGSGKSRECRNTKQKQEVGEKKRKAEERDKSLARREGKKLEKVTEQEIENAPAEYCSLIGAWVERGADASHRLWNNHGKPCIKWIKL